MRSALLAAILALFTCLTPAHAQANPEVSCRPLFATVIDQKPGQQTVISLLGDNFEFQIAEVEYTRSLQTLGFTPTIPAPGTGVMTVPASWLKVCLQPQPSHCTTISSSGRAIYICPGPKAPG